jgi:hypothetical protein
MRYGVGSRVFTEFDRAADASMEEALTRGESVDISVLTDEGVEIGTLVVSVRDVSPVEQPGPAPGAREQDLN